jgi:hypothetical protein
VNRPRGAITPRLIIELRKSLWVRRLASDHDASVEMVALIDRGWGDKPISQFKFRCNVCGGSSVNPRLDQDP